jgi:hypothetical protein
MDVIIMQSTSWLLNQLKNDHPEFVFEHAKEFLWSADRQTIYIDPTASHSQEFMLHELSHALLDHQGYKMDIELVKLERDAWEYARTHLASVYDFEIDDNVIQDNLDTYREWLHARSKCPDCDAIGIQTKSHHYRCLACGHTWRVNEARLCALRRYSVKMTK